MDTRSKLEDKELTQIERFIRETPVEVDIVNRTMDKYESSRDTKQSEKFKARKNLRQRIMMITVSAAMIVSLIIITGLISPTMAAAMKEVPLLSSVFKFTRDLGLHAADEKGLSTKLNISVTHEGFTLNVTEVVYDGTRVAIGIERHHKEDENAKESLSEQISNIEFLLNGEPLNHTNFSSVFGQPSKDKNSAILEFADLKNQGGSPFPKQFNLTFSATINGVSKPFKMDIPVSDIGNYVNLQPNISRKYKNNQFTIEQIVLTPITTSITTRIALLDKTTSVDFREGISIEVYDEQGHELKLIHGNGRRETNKGNSDFIMDLRVHPFETVPKAITMKPYIHLYDDEGSYQLDENGDPKIQYIPELEITIPINSKE
ncbi:DUF4179 domain-containing protein [Lysinibacillus sp. OL1_EC]|uniref:DUF4179 domain-containing protein n=1 Tax=unclassified Lysinibacillus TaxID=2636778 RepID=UPI00103DBD76|nr:MULTISPECIES: DUF4179 domain-containing protein [unclassified Lysinibacillus]MCM0624930.1 DUF4179 domain-containing protein [Lysinibacillus sp. OL1_EC]MCS5502551.1 DUF4179 domain-containing protein [Lysinibacillus sp. A4]TBV87660.1 DUF4179 domain-containing protein [Lysinibacillus sp. OL1]UKJ45144.1 DUF4179 domain-containing protein [Lysinibacillus sp. ACHW1.5]WGT40263.1 DUF4179 domain-containing protein [Lysinibacillus sp. 1 U-2021]